MRARQNRRSFLRSGVAIGAAMSLPITSACAVNIQRVGTDDQIGVGMIGAGGRAGELLSAVRKVPGVKVLAVADPDSKLPVPCQPNAVRPHITPSDVS